jgi:hypothetical protein
VLEEEEEEEEEEEARVAGGTCAFKTFYFHFPFFTM